ncbi:type II toxin-antitoxin system ParD family antitoxin [Granulicella sibirica]|uniref:Putative transcriptional regulators containing the CopG/Arc/MetJ DNA-binding domain n=1 Tax=Granulicella sibirica TaxID=2479048 RepID=A0A4Q0T210_9BACT|nr:type II toxin-antitoxin system ParD family antitoxin [Granulicella sibirica]RXH57685.1 putative transcriptional regulators containing the CopG/Arc/MetJ DNA-binding domain [Granulicella sibirica]
MPTRNLYLTDTLDSFVASGVEDGRYSNASEVVREGLRMMQQREAEDLAKIARLRGAAQEGIESIERGEFVTLSGPDSIRQHSRGLRARS